MCDISKNDTREQRIKKIAKYLAENATIGQDGSVDDKTLATLSRIIYEDIDWQKEYESLGNLIDIEAAEMQFKILSNRFRRVRRDFMILGSDANKD